MRALGLMLASALATGCMTTQHGSVTPSLEICNLGTFDQRLVFARDFTISRVGDDGYDDDALVRASLAADAERVRVRGACPGKRKLGTFQMVLKRIEVGSTRSAAAKLAMWIVLILPSLGFSSIYPLTENRWMTIDLDAVAYIGDKPVWSGQFTSHLEQRALQKELPTTGAAIGDLMKRAQASAVADLVAATRTEARVE